MGLTTLQVCMDSSVDWLQGTIHEDGGMDSSSSPDILTCSRPLIERRLRPQHEQALKCPRCDSTHTKFCYYNNYSLSQPRYFCKTCRRYWTKGGTLRNIPVGGGCRKNKKLSSSSSTSSASANNNNNKKTSSLSYDHQNSSSTSSPSSIVNHVTFPELQFPHNHSFGNFNLAPGFLGIDNPTPIDFMESGTCSRNQDFLGNGEFGMMMMAQSTFPAQFGIPIDGGNNNVGPASTLMLPYDHHHHDINHHHQFNHAMMHDDVKPNPKLLSLEWHDQGCSDQGYLNGVGSWTGLMNGYGSSTTNPLI